MPHRCSILPVRGRAPKSPNAQLNQPKVVAVFLVVFAAGFGTTLATLILFPATGADSAPPRTALIGAAALMSAGLGGLIGAWAGFGGGGCWALAVFAAIVTLALGYGITGPYLRRRQELAERASYVGLTATVTRTVPAGGTGEVSFTDREGTGRRLPAKSADASELPVSAEVAITGVDAKFVHVCAAD